MARRGLADLDGYIVEKDGRFTLQSGTGRVMAKCVRTGVSRRRPGSRGSWISSTTESFRCETPDGQQFVGRNGGSSLAIFLRKSKRPVKMNLSGVRRNRRSRR